MGNSRKRKNSKSASKLKYVGLGVAAAVALGLTALALNQPTPDTSAVTRPVAPIAPTPTETAATLLSGLPEGSTALIIGDSYTQGHAAAPQTENGYAYVLSRDLGWITTVNGIGGTGYTAGGGNGGSGTQKFSNRITDLAGPELAPDVVILQGSGRADGWPGSDGLAVRRSGPRRSVRSLPALGNDGREQQCHKSRCHSGRRPLR
jgi:hypothetical protein